MRSLSRLARTRPLSAIAVTAVAFGIVACGGGGSVAPLVTNHNASGETSDLRAFAKHAPMLITNGARLMSALHERAPSPGSVAIPPFDHSVRFSSSMLAKRATRLHPNFIQGSPNWSQLSGAYVQVLVSPLDGSIWALVNSGGGPDYPIAHYTNGSWVAVNGDAARLAIDPNGDTLWAVNSAGGIYDYNISNATWSGIGGAASDVTIGADNTVYVLSNTGGDGAGNFPIWHYAQGAWQSVPGEGSRISASWDPNQYDTSSGTTMAPGGFFVFTALASGGTSGGVIYYYNPGNGYLQVPGQVEALAPVSGGLFAVGGASGPGVESPIYFYEYASGGWSEEPGDAVSVAATNSTLYVITSSGGIWTTPVLLKNPFISEFYEQTAPNSFGIVEGPDNDIWETDYSGGYIRTFTGAGVPVKQIALPVSGGQPYGIAVGSDHSLWFTDNASGEIGRVTTASAITEYPIPAVSGSPSPSPQGITGGPDGNLWFTEPGSNRIAKITTAHSFTQYPIALASASPQSIAAGSDGALWFTEPGRESIGRITTSGAFSQYAIPSGNTPANIASGPDGALWFTETGAENIGRVTTSGSFTEYSVAAQSANLPGSYYSPSPFGIAAGPDNAMWFTCNGYYGSIGRITMTGQITLYPYVNSGISYGQTNFTPLPIPQAIAPGPGGSLWATSGEYGDLFEVSLQ